ncbi:streptophobe family protein [Streptomyces sp. NPDC059766]|uniref:streptophobe family protein n=1 Tax=Streptomyces sp. NPDC059766 TaxID=3346940 RepID=UPI003668D9BA
MSAGTGVGTGEGAGQGRSVPWVDVLLSAIAAVSWALIGMAGTAALGLHLLEADTAGSLGPMTAAVVTLGAGGSVSPSGDVSAFGLKGAQTTTAIEITPLGVGLVGALLLSWFFLRSLRTAGVVVAPAELLARAGTVIALFVAMLGGLAWAGHDVVTLDGGSLGLDDLPGGGGGGGGVSVPGLGDLGNIGGLLPDRLGDLVDAKAAVGFSVDTAPTLLGGLGWAAGVLLIALLASRRTPLPAGWTAVHRVVRPAVSALVTVMLVAVAAGVAAAAYAAIGDDHPRRIAGAALLGAPNGVWLGLPIGLFVPWDGRATGALGRLLPDPLDRLLDVSSDRPVTLGRLADLDGRVWLLAVAAALAMLLAGVLTAVRTPVGTAVRARAGTPVDGPGTPGVGGTGTLAASGRPSADVPSPGPGTQARAGGGPGRPGDPGALGFAGRCALRLGVVTALALPLLAWLTEVSVNASLSVLGFDAFGAGIELHGRLGAALLLGAVWGAGAGAVGALLAYGAGAAGRRAAPLALGDTAGGRAAYGIDGGPGVGVQAGGRVPGPYAARPYGAPSGPYVPGAPHRPPNPDTNPYLRLPDELREPQDARPPDGGSGTGGPGYRAGTGAAGDRPGTGTAGDPARTGAAGASDGRWRPSGEPTAHDDRYDDRHGDGHGDRRDDGPGDKHGDRYDDVYGAPTMARPIDPPPRRSPGPRPGQRPPTTPEEGPPPPPPPPAPRRPR